MTAHALRTTPARRAPSRDARSWRYVSRSLQMVAAMLAGMLTLAPVERVVWRKLTARADVGVLVLTTNMSIGLAAWMRVRGHRWRDTGETSALICLPFLALLATGGAGSRPAP